MANLTSLNAGEVAPADDDDVGTPRISPAGASMLGRLFRDYAEPLRCYIAVRFGAGPPEPEDVVQAAFTRFAGTVDPSAVRNPRAFLYATACNFVIDHRRQAAHRTEAHLDIWHRSKENMSEVSPENVLVAKEQLAIYQSALDRMPAMRRRIFLMVRALGHSPAMLAEQFGVTESAINKHVSRALADCAAALAKMDQKGKYR